MAAARKPFPHAEAAITTRYRRRYTYGLPTGAHPRRQTARRTRTMKAKLHTAPTADISRTAVAKAVGASRIRLRSQPGIIERRIAARGSGRVWGEPVVKMTQPRGDIGIV